MLLTTSTRKIYVTISILFNCNAAWLKIVHLSVLARHILKETWLSLNQKWFLIKSNKEVKALSFPDFSNYQYTLLFFHKQTVYKQPSLRMKFVEQPFRTESSTVSSNTKFQIPQKWFWNVQLLNATNFIKLLWFLTSGIQYVNGEDWKITGVHLYLFNWSNYLAIIK